jgi:cysteine desulfurase/selenocysteine lyase
LNPYRDDFPILNEKINGRNLVYLDNASTTQKPVSVLQAVDEYYRTINANPHRGLYQLSVKATEAYENARHAVKEFIGSPEDGEVIFTRNATEALNLVAYSYGLSFLQEGDEIALPVSEHHSNLVPWQMVARAKGVKLNFLYPDQSGCLTDTEMENKITPKTKIVAFAHISNVLGTVNPVEKIIKKAHHIGAVTVVDCAQSIPHYSINVKELDADFIAFSGHKMLAPMGIGVLYGKRELLNKMPPFLMGGEMIEYVYEQSSMFAPLPQKFEAGTQNVEGAIGLASAIEYLNQVGYETIGKIESGLTAYALNGLSEIPHVTVYGNAGNAPERCGVISFNLEKVHPHDVASILDMDGVAIRAGHHCAQPLMKYLGVSGTCRMSLYFYNTTEDIDRFLTSLKRVRRLLGYEN